MRRIIALGAFAAVGTLAISSLAGGTSTQTATTMKFKAALSAAQVVPHLKGTMPGASGTFTATLTGTRLKWTLTYTHLTGPAVAAHIHMGARGKNGIALVSLCGPPPCKSPMRGTANAVTDDVGSLMAHGGAYVNVHTAKNEEGEIRGEISLGH
jgi:hypothetical protein